MFCHSILCTFSNVYDHVTARATAGKMSVGSPDNCDMSKWGYKLKKG